MIQTRSLTLKWHLFVEEALRNAKSAVGSLAEGLLLASIWQKQAVASNEVDDLS